MADTKARITSKADMAVSMVAGLETHTANTAVVDGAEVTVTRRTLALTTVWD